MTARMRMTIALLATLLAAPAWAGDGYDGYGHRNGPRHGRGHHDYQEPARAQLGGSLTLAKPQGEFEEFVDLGGGISGFAVVPMTREGAWGMRFDGSLLLYGREVFREPFNSRVSFDVETTNYIASLGIGPQLMASQGRVRPYLFGTVGFSYFATETSLSGSADVDDFASTVNYDDFTFALTGGGGLLLALSDGSNPVSLDVSMNYVSNGLTRYLREGSIVDLPDGSIAFDPIESETNMVLFRVGVSVGL